MLELTRVFLFEAVPDLRTILILGPPLALYIILWSFFVGRLKTKKDLKTGYTRKIFHFGIFTLAGILQLAFGLKAVVFFGSLTSIWIILSLIKGDGFGFYEAIARETDSPHRAIFVIIPLISTALGGIISNMLFSEFAAVGYLVTGWGDAIAEPVGVRFGKHKYKVPSLGGVPAVRSLEGSLSVFIVGFIAATIALSISGKPLCLAMLAALAIALTSTLTEAITNHGLDNLTIQIVASGVGFYFFSLI